MDNEENYIEIKNPTLCIICLEELDDDIKNICINCNIECHTRCLRKWYKSKKKQICPICLKTKKYYEKKRIENNEIEVQNISIVLNEENNIEEIENNDNNNEEFDEIGEGSDESDENERDENRDIELINYYLYRQNNGNICYRTVNELCCSKRTGSYLLIFILLAYTYSSMY